jgi:aubergine-like protein
VSDFFFYIFQIHHFNLIFLGMNFTITDPRIKIHLDDDRTAAYADAIDRCVASNPALIMVVVPNNKAERYAAIKRKSCVEHAIPTQVMLTKTLQPKQSGGSLFSVATKVAIQINTKLGGVPWLISLPLNGLMTIGFDVCHTSGSKYSGRKSAGALVATMDLKRSSKYYSSAAICGTAGELSNDLAVNVLKAVRAFQSCHGTLPQRILFYRDGVGEGQVSCLNLYLHKFSSKYLQKFSSKYLL